MSHAYEENLPNASEQKFRQPRAKPSAVTPSFSSSKAASVGRKALAPISDVTPVAKRSSTRIVFDTLRSFPGSLTEADASYRELLLEALEEQPKDAARWIKFLTNERTLLERAGNAALMSGRLKAARMLVQLEPMDLLAIELPGMSDPQKRDAFGALARAGTTASSLFVAWADLERACGALSAARAALEMGLTCGAPSSPGRAQLQRRLEEIEAVTVAAVPPVAEETSVGPKKSRLSNAPRRLLRNGLGGPAARIKQSDRQAAAAVDEDLLAAAAEPPPAPVETPAVQQQQPPPPASPSSGETSDDAAPNNAAAPRNRERRVKFASPAAAPQGPSAPGARPGSMSPAPSAAPSSRFLQPVASTSTRSSLSSAVDVSPISVSQTPMLQRGDKGATPGRGASRPGLVAAAETAEPSTSRVLFQSAIKPRRVLDEGPSVPAPTPAAAAVALVVEAAPAPVVAAPVVVPPPIRPSAAAAPGDAAGAEASPPGRRNGEELMLEKRRLKILAPLGSGGYSRVYKVMDCSTFEIFAMKDVAEPKDKDDRSFQNEVALLTQVVRLSARDANVRNRVVQLRAFVEAPGRALMLLELGELDVTRVLTRARREPHSPGRLPLLDMTELKHYWSQMLRCVCVLHENGIVHCDLKPANFVLVQGRLKVVDFGIAVHMARPEAQTKGTLNYLPPELCVRLLERREYESPQPARDVWALGCILFELAYGRTPFVPAKPREHPAVLMRQIADPNHVIDFPAGPPSLAVLNQCAVSCLRYRASERPTASALLLHKLLLDN